MDEAKPILSYASPGSGQPVDDGFFVSFASPPATSQIVACLLAVLMFLGTVAGLTIALFVKERHQHEVSLVIVIAVVSLGLVACAARGVAEVRRLIRFGAQPVELEVRDAVVTIRAP